MRAIAFDIIAFLAQLENFQKRLWEKKKFVADCHYLITLDNILSHFYDEIFANEKQIQEWQNLYSAENIKRENVHLIINTALFNHAFQAKLLATFDDLDNQIGGTIIHSDNFQALNLLQAKYQGQVKCIYIDPPYNTHASAIIYKNGYKHSSWLTLINNTLISSKNLLNKKNGVLCALIDDVEQKIFSQVIEQNYNEITGTVSIRIKPSGRPIPNGFALSHEYAIFAKTNPNYPISRLEHNDEQKARYREKDEMGLFFWEMFRKAGSNSNRENRPTMFYPFYLNLDNNRLRLPQMEYDDKKQEYIIQEKTNNNEIAIYPIKDDGTDGCWYFGLERALSIINEFQARKQDDNSYRIYYRRRPNEGVQPTSLWFDAKYSATEHGTALLKDLFGKQEIFSYPKSIYAVMDCLIVSGAKIETNAFILDYFAGSGTTAHAVINLNREDNGNRKFILVEQGEYFNTVLKPRIQKVIFAKDYKDGKPVADKDEQFGGISQIVKVLKLESYEDTLNNLQLKSSDLFDRLPENTQNDYVLNYMLNIESRESLLNVADFAKPFDYQLNITTDSAGAFVCQKIDLVETFNYLIGATVLGMTDRRDKEGVVEIECQLPHQTNDDKTLIFWRDCEKVGYDDIKTMFAKRSINPKESQYQEIYINGDHTLDTVWENADGTQNTLKIKSIEQAFLDLMFGEI